MKKNDASRRHFLRTAGTAAAGFMIVPSHVLGRGYIAPSDKLNIAGIGVGGKGESDLAEFAKSPKVNIVALCDVDDRQAATSRKSFPVARSTLVTHLGNDFIFLCSLRQDSRLSN